jgi:hypothetical protein
MVPITPKEVPVALNIKNEETLTAAITTALVERRTLLAAREQARRDKIIVLANDCAARLSAGVRGASIDELLYDDRGMPA